MKLLLILSLFIMIGCSAAPRHVQLANNITHPFCKQLQKAHHLYLIGSGGEMMDNIESISLTFVSHQKINAEQGRIILVEVVDSLLKRINYYSSIRPYLNTFPFTAANLDISILFETPSGDFLIGDVLASLSVCEGRVSYARYDSLNKKLFTIYREPYQEAQNIVRGQGFQVK
jgi:hypothetical protein